MTLTTKINLALAGLMMESAYAARAYTIQQVKPLLADRLGDVFLSQTVPSYAATQQFTQLRQAHPEYWYKESTLNPTNPADRATEWEAGIIQQFRNDAALDEVTDKRQTPTGPALYLARPMRVNEPGCLTGHGVPGDARPTMMALYGSNNGFGWKMNEVVGSQIVSVPLSVPYQRAKYAFRVFRASQLAVLAAIFIVVNVALRLIVVRPARG